MTSGNAHEVATSISFLGATPQFTVPDLVRTAEYYRDVLGFDIYGYRDGERASLGAESAPLFCIVSRDKVQVFFNAAYGSPPRTGRAEFGNDAYFRVTGVDALADELRSRGAEILDGPEDREYGQRELVIKDCNGLVLTFGEDISGRQ